jgi:hypothetical protein
MCETTNKNSMKIGGQALVWPAYKLKDSYKTLIRTDSNLLAILMLRFGVNAGTIRRWLATDDLRTLSYPFLLLIWDYLTAGDTPAEKNLKIFDIIEVVNS